MRRRSEILKRIRAFFEQRGYLEVSTPLLAPSLIPEAPIEVFETQLNHEFYGSYPLYLIPSPEVFMKKLIAAGSGDMYQICKSFRNSEQIGRQHNPEFEMLEWYSMGLDYLQSIELTEELFDRLTTDEHPAALRPPFRRLSIEEAFRDLAGFSLEEHQALPGLVDQALKLGLIIDKKNPGSWEELFNRIFLNFVEPKLPQGRPLVLYDYPRQIPCLAKDIPGSPWKERWELYVQGVEIANCYSEETDPSKVEEFFRRESARKAAYSPVVPDADEEFLALFHQSFPECSGVALGIDRLVMALTGHQDIGGVIFFPISDTLQR